MATGALVPSELTSVGVALQTTKGTPVTATNFLRVTSVKPQQNIPYLPDNSFQGDMAKVHDEIQGPTSVALELGGNLYADEVGWPLASLLGDLTVTGTQDPYDTTFSLLNSNQGQTKYYTFTYWNGSDGLEFVDCKCNEVTIAYTASGLVTVDSKWDGISATTTTQPTTSYASTRAQPAWRATVSINSLTGPLVTDISLDLKRTNIPVAAMTSTSAQPVADIFNAGDLDFTGTATVVYDATNGSTIYGYFTAGTIIPIVVDLAVTESSKAHEIKFTSTQALITQATLQPASANYVSMAIQFEGIANTTDVGSSGGRAPVQATTKAGLASGTFA
jgi:hypothetical protein